MGQQDIIKKSEETEITIVWAKYRLIEFFEYKEKFDTWLIENLEMVGPKIASIYDPEEMSLIEIYLNGYIRTSDPMEREKVFEFTRPRECNHPGVFRGDKCDVCGKDVV